MWGNTPSLLTILYFPPLELLIQGLGEDQYGYYRSSKPKWNAGCVAPPSRIVVEMVPGKPAGPLRFATTAAVGAATAVAPPTVGTNAPLLPITLPPAAARSNAPGDSSICMLLMARALRCGTGRRPRSGALLGRTREADPDADSFRDSPPSSGTAPGGTYSRRCPESSCVWEGTGRLPDSGERAEPGLVSRGGEAPEPPGLPPAPEPLELPPVDAEAVCGRQAEERLSSNDEGAAPRLAARPAMYASRLAVLSCSREAIFCRG